MESEWIARIVAGIFGACIGSFLNVCVSRLPEGESVVAPRSRCPECGTLWHREGQPAIMRQGELCSCGRPVDLPD